MFKRFLISGLLVCFVGLILFYQTLFSMASAWVLHSYSKHYFSEPLQYEKISFDGHTLTLKHPRLAEQFEAQDIRVHFNIDWWVQKLNLVVHLNQPIFKLDPFPIKEHSWEALTSKKSEWFKLNPTWLVQAGTFKWQDKNQQDQSMHFDLELDALSGGYLKAQFANLEFNQICIQAKSKSDQISIEMDCYNVQCPCLLEMISIFYPQLEAWKTSSGVINGRLSAVFPFNQRPYLDGELTAQDFSFIQSKMEIKGHVKKARLKLEKNEQLEKNRGQDIAFIGQLDFLEPAHLTSFSKQQFWQFENILGSLKLDHSKTAHINLEALGISPAGRSQLNINGLANLNASKLFNVHLTLNSQSEQQEMASVDFLIQQPQGPIKIAEIQCQKLSYVEWGLLQNVVSKYWPDFHKLELQKGTFDALLHAKLTRRGFEQVVCSHFQAENLNFKVVPWAMNFYFPNWQGKGSIDLSVPNIWQTLNAEAHIQNGQIGELSSNAITNIQTHLLIDQGTIHSSSVTLNLADLKGLMSIEWGREKKLLSINLNGKAQEIAKWLPDRLQQGIEDCFENNQLSILGNIKKESNQFCVDGSLHVQRHAESNQIDLLHFGCKFNKNSEGLLAPIGWFYAKELPLDKFVSPFIFRKGVAKLTGWGEVMGSFDAEKILLKYEARDLKLENEDVLIEIKDHVGSLPGSHVFNLKTNSHEGKLPIQSASYLEKNTGIVFADIKTTTLFKDDTICLESIEGSCEGIYVQGQIDLDYSSPLPGVFNVAVSMPFFNGKISQIQRLLTHFKHPAFLATLPLEGEIEAKDKGLLVEFNFIPKDYNFKADFQGSISNGTLPIENFHMNVQDLNMDVEYTNGLLRFSHIQGDLLAGKHLNTEEYLLVGEHIQFSGLENPAADINVEIKHKEQSLMRIVAHTSPITQNALETHLDDQLSHFFGIYPKQFKLEIEDWSSIRSFALKAPFQLEDIWKNVQSLAPTGLFLPKHLLEQAMLIKHAKGSANLDLNYQSAQHAFFFEIEGNHIHFDDWIGNSFTLKGKKIESKWSIDQLQVDQLSIAADIEKHSDEWKIGFLALNYGHSLVLGLDGIFLEKECCFVGHVNMLEASIDDAHEWPFLKPYFAKWHPKGLIKGKGTLDLELLDQAPWLEVESNLQITLKEMEINSCPIHIKQSFPLNFISNQQVELSNVFFAFAEDTQEIADFAIDCLHYDIVNEQVNCSKMAFHIPAAYLEKMGQKIQHHFLPSLDNKTNEMFKALKTEGNLAGHLNFDKNQDTYVMNVNLEEGTYHFKNRDIYFKELNLALNPNELQFEGVSQHERCPFAFTGTTDLPHLQSGQINIHDLSKAPPLSIKWIEDAKLGFAIQSMHGSFCGLKIALDQTKAAPFWSAMQGQVEVDVNHVGPLLNKKIADKIQDLQLGSCYALQGLYWIDPELGVDLFDMLFFQGNLFCQQAILKGFLVDEMHAKLDYSPRHLIVEDLTMLDPAIEVKSTKLILTQDEKSQEWSFFAPHLFVKNFKPILLRDAVNSDQSDFTTLLVRRIEMTDFHGNVDEAASWHANGYLHFLNPARKNLFHPLLAIPAEIILRLGLDPQVLNPVTGTIYFFMQDERFYLTKFKDVYSEGRCSKFYLAQSEEPSWMDMKGNLHVQIRMKQYNLIFKIAELFTVSIQGHIKKPTYSLQRQNKQTEHKIHQVSLIK